MVNSRFLVDYHCFMVVGDTACEYTGQGKGQRERVFHAFRSIVFGTPRRKWLFIVGNQYW